MMRRAGRVVAEMHEQHPRRRSAPASPPLELDRIGRDVHRAAGRHVELPQLPRLPGGDLRVAERHDRARHPRRRTASREGDIISIDCGAIVDGWHGDAAFTVGVGEITAEAQRLIEVTEASLHAGIAADGRRQPHRRHRPRGAGAWPRRPASRVVREYVGHAIGQAMHEEPEVPNYGRRARARSCGSATSSRSSPWSTPVRPTPMLLDDGWSVVTADGALSAHWEHTIAITDDGPEILTAARLSARLRLVDAQVGAIGPGTLAISLRLGSTFALRALPVPAAGQRLVCCRE